MYSSYSQTPGGGDSVMILTGLGPVEGGAVLTGAAWPSPDSSSWLLMSSVVKRLDSSPRMWMIANLLEGLGCTQIHQDDKKTTTLFYFSELTVNLTHRDSLGKQHNRTNKSCRVKVL